MTGGGSSGEGEDEVGPGERPARRLKGVVLAGGESRRFGSDKALFPLLGRPMAAWALGALEPHFPRPVVVANDPALADQLGAMGRPDRVEGLGPLGGLRTALEWASDEGLDGVFLLGADLPLVESGLVGRILNAWPAHAAAVVPGSEGPLGLEPLCAGYGVACLPAVEKTLRQGRRSMEEVLTSVGAFRIPPEELGSRAALELSFTNVNTLDDARRVEGILRDRGFLYAGGPPAPDPWGGGRGA